MFKKPSKSASASGNESLEALLSQRFKTAVDINDVVITPEEVLRLISSTSDYLCPKSANIYEIEFTKFRVRDLSHVNKNSEHIKPPVLIDIAKPDNYEETVEEQNDPTAGRFVRYHLHKEFLDLRTLGAQITFKVGGKKVAKKFRMIERHYFKDKLIKSFDFDFGAALIPNSENSIEHIYEMPKLGDKVKRQMVDNPWMTKSDSFYFVENRLVMHNKAEYSYNFEP